MAKLSKGMEAPDFELKDASGKTWRLRDLKGNSVVLFFYPADDTPGCTREACDFRDSKAVWEEAGYTILGISPQGVKSKRSFIDKFSLNFPLLIDKDRAVERAYGTSRDEVAEYEGIPLTTLRSTFLIDEDGIIEAALYGVKAPGHVDELRSMVGV